MYGWLAILAAPLLLMGLFLRLTYYPRRAETSFWTTRYRIVKGVDHAGPILEFGAGLVIYFCLLYTALDVYPELTIDTVAKLGRSKTALAVGAVALLALVWIVYRQCFVRSMGETRDLLSEDSGKQRKALEALPLEPRTRVGRVVRYWDRDTKAEQIETVRKLYRPYFCYSLLTSTLLAAFLGLNLIGLSQDAVSIYETNRAVRSGEISTSDAAQTAKDCEALAKRFSLYEDAVIETATHLLALAATSLFFAFWLLGTPFQTIFTKSAVGNFRLIAFLVLVVGLPVLIGSCYTHLVVSNYALLSKVRLSAQEAQVSLSSKLKPALLPDRPDAAHVLDPKAAARADKLKGFCDQMSARAASSAFWRRLAESSGFMMFLSGLGLSLLQKSFSGTSFLGGLIPGSCALRHGSLLRVLFSPPEHEPSDPKGDEEPCS